jgi:hypothetical protein
MLKALYFLALIFSWSCALRPQLLDLSLESALSSIQILGEGRGRIALDRGEYVFSYESLMRDQDWLMAVNIPLRGEELMVLRNIKEESAPSDEVESFEERLKHEIDSNRKNNSVTGEEYVRELRSLVRFVLAPSLGLQRRCEEEKDILHRCFVGKQDYLVEIKKDQVLVRRRISSTQTMELIAENLTDSFFTRTGFSLHSQNGSPNSLGQMSLQLFWK